MGEEEEAESERQERAPPTVPGKKTAESQQHSHSKQTSNTRERDTLIWLPPQEAGIFRKSSKCKLIYYRKRTPGAVVQPNRRHQRVKAQTVSSSPRRPVSFPRLGALAPVRAHLRPAGTLTGVTRLYMSAAAISEAAGPSVCASASSSPLTRGAPGGDGWEFRMCEEKESESGCFCQAFR